MELPVRTKRLQHQRFVLFLFLVGFDDLRALEGARGKPRHRVEGVTGLPLELGRGAVVMSTTITTLASDEELAGAVSVKVPYASLQLSQPLIWHIVVGSP